MFGLVPKNVWLRIGYYSTTAQLSSYLAFVGAVISFLNELDLQMPVLRVVSVQHCEPVVVRVRHQARAEDVPVPSPHPGNL